MYTTVLEHRYYNDKRAWPCQAKIIDSSGNVRRAFPADHLEVGTMAPAPEVVIGMAQRLWAIRADHPKWDGHRKDLPASPPVTLAEAMAVLRGWAYDMPAHILTKDGQMPEIGLQPLSPEWCGGQRGDRDWD